MSLKEYERKRSFDATPEPRGHVTTRRRGGSLLYVVQKHQASHLHYDFRLEWNGVLLSWAVPKGPSLNPAVKRLAMRTEDHPVDYGDFEGVIPPGQYGAGTVMVWDTGTWLPDNPDVDSSLRKGDLKFTLCGKKLKGSWVLVRTRGFGKSLRRSSWLLIKHRDPVASTEDITVDLPQSAASGRLLADIAQEAGGDVHKARKGDAGDTGSQPTSRRPPMRKRKTASREQPS